MISIVRKPVREGQVSRLNRRQRGERGSVLTEFVMVAPVMLLIAGSALRFYQELQAKEIGITFAREVATLAYNRCIDKTSTTVIVNAAGNEQVTGNPDETLKQIEACINGQVLPNFIQSWESAKPIASGASTIKITVEAYRCDIEQISPTTCNMEGKVICERQSGDAITPCGKNITNASGNLSALRNRKIIAKIEFTMTPLAIFVPSISSTQVTYEATV
ncbi:MAG: hypothetical protein RL326_1393 [Pseudomonadota bacterium]|jgi:hypothetical protein